MFRGSIKSKRRAPGLCRRKENLSQVDNSSETSSKSLSLALFVHGFSSSRLCWKPLLDLMAKDSRISGKFKLEPFGYFTAKVDLNPLRRIPTLKEIACDLDDFIKKRLSADYPERYTDLTLIGHSMGGLLIQEYIAMKLGQPGESRDLGIIRQVLLIATPNRGSITLETARDLFSRFINNPQDECLRVFSPEIDEVTRIIEERVIAATTRDDHQWPIPFHVFWGNSDNVVPQASARASFEVANPLSGDHFSVLKPDTLEDDRYQKIADALLHPAGHKHVFEIKTYTTSVEVQPLAPGAQDCVAEYGDQKRPFKSDNFARLVRSVEFATTNICTDRYRFNYRANIEGFLVETMSFSPKQSWEKGPINVAAKDEVGRYESSRGTEVTFEIIPQAGRTYTQALEIWKGFDQGRRDLHFHLGNCLRCAVYRFSVDLTAYVRAGWTVTRKPELFVFPDDTGCSELCANRKRNNPVTPASVDPLGLWWWEIPDFREGVVDAVWDVAPPVLRSGHLNT